MTFLLTFTQFIYFVYPSLCIPAFLRKVSDLVDDRRYTENGWTESDFPPNRVSKEQVIIYDRGGRLNLSASGWKGVTKFQCTASEGDKI